MLAKYWGGEALSEIEAKVGRGAYAKGGGGAYAGEYGTRKCYPDFVIFLGYHGSPIEVQ